MNLNEHEQFDLMNVKFFSKPKVIHGGGPIRKVLNQYSNYLAGTYVYNECRMGQDNPVSETEATSLTIFIALFIERPTPFLEQFFEKIRALDYPKEKIHIFIHNVEESHSSLVEKYYYSFLDDEYSTVQVIDAKHGIQETDAREMAVRQCVESFCDYLFSVDSEAHLDNPDTLKELIMLNKSIIAPILLK